MKKNLFTCFLVPIAIGTCLAGSPSAQSKVADSPMEAPNHRSALHVSPHSGDTHRGGAILSDTFSYQNGGMETSSRVPTKHPTPQFSLELSGGEAPDSPHRTTLPFPLEETASLRASARSDVSGLASNVLHLQSSFSLVDQHLGPGAGEESSVLHPAPVTVLASSIRNNQKIIRKTPDSGSLLSPVLSTLPTRVGKFEASVSRLPSQSPVLIYGEIVNPDSLGPIKLELTPYYVDRKSAFLKKESLFEPEPGTFVDGVVDPRAMKFSGELPALQRPAYISISVGDRMLLDQYIVFPDDSIKISINLRTANLIFAGPAAKSFELQYQLKRLRLLQGFDRPRKVVVGDPEILLGEGNNRELWENNKTKFSSKLEFGYYGIEGLEKLLEQLSSGKEGVKEQNDLIGFYSEFLEPGQIDLIRLDAYSLFYFSPVYTLSKFYYDDLNRRLSADSLLLIKERIRASLEGIQDRDFGIDSKLISAEYLNLQVEKLTLLALIDGVSYLDLVHARFDGELADRLKASFLTQNLRRYPEPEKMIGQYLKGMESEPWKERIKTLGESTIPGSSLIALEMEDTAGEIHRSEDLLTQPTLIYFYFSSCVHSAHYFRDMLWPMYQQVAKEKEVRLIAVSVDKDRSLWLKNLSEYSNSQIDNYRLTEKSKNEFVGFYEISGYPRTFLITPERKILAFNLDRSDYSKFTEDFLRHLPKLSDHTSNPNPQTP